MNILLIAATRAEIAPLTEYIAGNWESLEGQRYEKNGYTVEILFAGVGMVATAYALTRALSQTRFDLVIQAGIAGTFDRTLPLGSVVFVSSEMFGDLGAEDAYNFIDVFDLGFAEGDKPPFSDKRLLTPVTGITSAIQLPRVSAISVNTVTGSSFTAESRSLRTGCQTENMEGAALHYVCLKEGVPFIQIRAISNYVEARDKSKWKIGEAVANLNDWLKGFIDRTV